MRAKDYNIQRADIQVCGVMTPTGVMRVTIFKDLCETVGYNRHLTITGVAILR